LLYGTILVDFVFTQLLKAITNMTNPTKLLHQNVPSLLIAHSDLLNAELIAMLSVKASFKVAGIVTDGNYLFDRLSQEQPEYLLIDTDLPNCGSYGFLKKISHNPISTKVIVYSNSDSSDYLKAFLSSPAIGFIQKGCGISEFTACLQKVFQGKRMVFSQIADFHTNLNAQQNQEQDQFDLTKLTERETEVWELLVKGKSEKEMAEILCLSTSTIRTHKNKISDKLSLKGKKKLSKFALSH
jgi:DNA-binding NarL/FixJ family response regulator